ARATLEELGLSLELNETRVYSGIVELLAGDAARAVGELRAARAGFASLGAEAAEAHAAAQLARALVAQGGRDSARDAIAQATFAQGRSGHDLRTALIAAGALAEALASTGETEQATEIARGAVASIDATDALPDKADASMSLARVLLAAGDPGGAEAAARAAT